MNVVTGWFHGVLSADICDQHNNCLAVRLGDISPKVMSWNFKVCQQWWYSWQYNKILSNIFWTHSSCWADLVTLWSPCIQLSSSALGGHIILLYCPLLLFLHCVHITVVCCTSVVLAKPILTPPLFWTWTLYRQPLHGCRFSAAMYHQLTHCFLLKNT